ncbi:MAG: GFA family protein [Notoacmeibacter sp.]
MTANPITGGCQCGAVRYSCESLGRPSICHCRMCQKAFGSFFAPLVTGIGVTWTRGTRKIFHSSNSNYRGFCENCGTPLTYEHETYGIEIAIGTLDNPDIAIPQLQVNLHDEHACFAKLAETPKPTQTQLDSLNKWNGQVVSYQHPDHDTDNWPPAGFPKR